MKKVNCIRVFFIVSVLFVIGCYQVLALNEAKEPVLPPEPEQEALIEEESEAKQEALPVIHASEYKFVIVEECDYLTVYTADKSAVYEYTDIRYSDLEDSLRQKIRKGYCIKDEETLFGFLENYSS